MQQVEFLTSVGTIANMPETSSSKAQISWLMTKVTQITEACIGNELYNLHRGVPFDHAFDVDGTEMKWGKTHQTTASKWKEAWKAVTVTLAEVRYDRGGGTSCEEVTAASTVEVPRCP